MSNNSREIQATGLILISLGIIVLISPVMLDTFSSITGISIELLGMASIGAVAIGIVFLILGLKSRKESS